jgi:GT2 family glycosyltransferase
MTNQAPLIDLSIIIVNWNSADYVRRCIASILVNTANIEYEIIVVDSGSFDGCAPMLQRTYPQVRFVQSKLNVGFARANNLGAEYAHGSVLLFLNPDTEVSDGAIARMHRHLSTLATPGVVGCRLLNRDGSLQTSCVQSLPTILNQVLDLEVLRRWLPSAKLFGTAALFTCEADAQEVEAVSGACMMIRREIFGLAGGFSADFFMYGEDLDLCFKVRQKGFRNYHVGDTVIVHFGGGCSQRTISKFSTVMTVESVNRLLRKSRGGTYSFCYRLTMSGVAAVRLATLCLLFPAWSAFRTNSDWDAVFWKWLFILRWGVGAERRWTKQYEQRDQLPTDSNNVVETSCAGSAEN